MFKKILIANRGEVALRIIRACHELNIETVIVYSTEDRNSLPVKLATESICIGPGKPIDSYLNISNILSAAIITKADGIHPGYGFLSENPEFVELVEKCGIQFIGPSKESMETLGNKSKARRLMAENDIPIIPGTNKNIESLEELKKVAREIGYPIIIKAASGGGGRGMRVVFEESDLEKEYLNAKSEAKICFGDDKVYIEKYIIDPRHIEVQILADKKGNIIHLGERDCSIQRKNQKILEETPSPNLNSELRKKLAEISVKIAKITNYKNAGTVEFVLDKNNNYFFLEMNTRLQVEHTISEMVTGIDIVREQIRIASGLELSCMQDNINFKGHALQCRINRENIYENFRPSIGEIKSLNIPNGFNIRFDSHIYNNYKVCPYYDSLLGKLIVKGENRLHSIRKMRSALEELVIEGLDTNIELHYGILHDFDFVKGKYNTNFLEEKLKGDFKNFYLEMKRYYEK